MNGYRMFMFRTASDTIYCKLYTADPFYVKELWRFPSVEPCEYDNDNSEVIWMTHTEGYRQVLVRCVTMLQQQSVLSENEAGYWLAYLDSLAR